VLDHPAKLDLAPGPAGGRGAQRTGQGGGLAAQRLAGEPDRLDLLAQPGVLVHPVPFQRGDLLLDPGQCAGQWGERCGEHPVGRLGALPPRQPFAQQVVLGLQHGPPGPGDQPGQ
jgi:hypothetical protein